MVQLLHPARQPCPPTVGEAARRKQLSWRNTGEDGLTPLRSET